MAKKRKSAYLDEDIIYCWFCEREFNDSMVLIAHQKAKHFTCHLCQKKLNSASGLVGHLKSMHKEKLEAIPNALAQRADPERGGDILGMDGIPELDYEEYKTRRQAPLLPSIPPAPGTTPMVRPTFAAKVEPPPGIAGATAKKAKIDTPLDETTIQAQLAEFQKKKEQEQVQHLISSGIALPPGLPHNLVLSKFPTVPPPGEGTYAATKLPAAFNTSSINGLEGKSSDNPAINPSSNISYTPASNSSNPNPNATSNPNSNAAAVKEIKMAPPPSLKFTKTDTILSLSPPTPLPLAPGQTSHAGTPVPPPPRGNSIGGTQGGMQQGYPPPQQMGRGGMPGPYGIGTQNMGRGVGYSPRGGARMAPLPQQYPPAYGRGGPGVPPGRGNFPYPPPPQPQFSMGAQGQFNQFNRGRGGPRNMPMGGRPPYPPVPAPAPLHLTPQGYTPYTGPPQTSPPPFANQASPPPYAYPSQQQQQYPPHGYPSYAQSSPPAFPPRAQPPPQQNVPFEVLYPMHGKKAPAFSPPSIPSPSLGIPPAMSPTNTAPPGMPLPPSMSPGAYPPYPQSGSPGQSSSPTGFFSPPPLPSSPPPIQHQGPISLASQPQTQQIQGQGGKMGDVRIISDDFVSPEEKLAAKYGYHGKS